MTDGFGMGQSVFADQVLLILKALSLSRGRLAADIGVDKSLIGRWCSGAVRPSSYNLVRLTEYIASRSPGFTLHDWDASLEALAERFGVEAAAPAPPPLAAVDWFPLPMLNEAVATVRLRGADYEGIWRSTRPSSEMRGQFIHDHVLLRRAPNGMLSFTIGVFSVRFTGWSLLLQHQVFSMATDIDTGTFVFAIFNGVARQRAEVVDGLVLTCMRDASGTPIASKVLLTRVADLTGDAARDQADFEARMTAYPFSPAETIAPEVREHLWQDVGQEAFTAGGDPMLMMQFAQSMSRGPVFEGAAESSP